MRRHSIVIPLAALIVILPLLSHGCSCGHDFGFHIRSWLEAATQFRHGTLNLHWAFTPAFHAGEPRFVFYPPLSWMLGGVLTLVFPLNLAPALYTFLVLLSAGFAMHHLARHFVSRDAALLASAFYLANPYMLFNAFERTAYAELLAAVWLPLLFLAALRDKPTIRQVSWPIALLWLTNAPAAVMGCYALALIVVVRLVTQIRFTSYGKLSALKLAGTMTGGSLLGLSLAAFYLIPAAYERRFVQIAMAIIPNMRFQDNFLFGHTGDGPHDRVLHTVSVLAVCLLFVTAMALVASFARNRSARRLQPRTQRGNVSEIAMAVLTLCIALLLTSSSTPLWNRLPELAFLQFPWRLLSVLAVVLTLAGASLFHPRSLRKAVAAPMTLVLVAAMTLPAVRTFRQGCEAGDPPNAQALALQTHHGVAATDEYTPTDADNDVLRSNDPAFWLAMDPAAFAPGTLPNPAATIPNYDTPPAPEQTISGRTPAHFVVHADKPEFLVLNLRDYPNWDVAVDATGHPRGRRPPHIARDDGLIALPLSGPGTYVVDITWRRSLDQQVGIWVSVLAGVIFLALLFHARSRRIEA